MKIKFSIPISSTEVSFATSARYLGEKRLFTHLSTSSCDADENTLFFALQGKRTSGDEFVEELSHRNICSLSRKHGEHILTHSSPLDALLMLAKYYKSKLTNLQKTIAITGSVGKTTTKEFLLRLLSQKWETHANEGNLNSEIGVPLTVFTASPETEMLILEFGMNHRGEIQRIAKSVLPDFGIITNIGHAHIGNLGSREAIAQEKMDICAHNADMPVLIDANEILLHDVKHKIGLFSDICIKECQDIWQFSYLGRNARIIKPSLPYDCANCMQFAIGAALALGLTEKELQNGIELCKRAPCRRKELHICGITIIDDTYNASPESMKCAISFLKETKGKRKYMVVGDMLELGEHTMKLHIELGNALANSLFDGIYLFGEYGTYTKMGLESAGYNMSSVYLFDDIQNYEGLLCALSKELKRGDVCLLKGSNASRMWRITEGLEEVYS